MIIDTHCHLDFDRFDADRDDVIERAEESGVRGFILIGIEPASWRATDRLCSGNNRFWRAAGLHPNSVADLWDGELEGALASEIETGSLVAIGESGVDLYRSRDSRELQMEAFDAHLRLAKSAGLPIVIHQRSAEDEVIEVLSRHQPVSGVMHCFSGDWDFAQKSLDLGLHLGIGGVATYPSAGATREAIRQAPLDRLLLETDAPFLAPQPVRGKRNEPGYLTYVVETIAETRGISRTVVEDSTTRNAVALFGIEI